VGVLLEQGVGELAGAHQDHPVGGPHWASILVTSPPCVPSCVPSG
jgi:hypothetical protein